METQVGEEQHICLRFDTSQLQECAASSQGPLQLPLFFFTRKLICLCQAKDAVNS